MTAVTDAMVKAGRQAAILLDAVAATPEAYKIELTTIYLAMRAAAPAQGGDEDKAERSADQGVVERALPDDTEAAITEAECDLTTARNEDVFYATVHRDVLAKLLAALSLLSERHG